MDLRRRSKNYVVEAIADEALLAIAQESARPNCDVGRSLSLKVVMSPSSHACSASARFVSRPRTLSMAAFSSTSEAAERNKGSS